MAGKREMQKSRLLEQRDKLLAEIEALKNRVMGFEMAISMLDETHTSEEMEGGKGRRSGAKALILDLLREVGTSGLNAAVAVEIAQRRGLSLDRSSVSSLLSRLKADGIVTYDGERYRLTDISKSSSEAGPFRVITSG